MAAANAGWNTYRAGQTLGNIGKELGELMKNGTVPTEAVSVSITYGEQKSVDTTHTEGSTANSSQVNAGGKVTITAAGQHDLVGGQIFFYDKLGNGRRKLTNEQEIFIDRFSIGAVLAVTPTTVPHALSVEVMSLLFGVR